MKLTAQMTTPIHNPVEYFGFTGAEIMDEQDYAAPAEIEYETGSIGMEEISRESSMAFIGH